MFHGPKYWALGSICVVEMSADFGYCFWNAKYCENLTGILNAVSIYCSLELLRVLLLYVY